MIVSRRTSTGDSGEIVTSIRVSIAPSRRRKAALSSEKTTS